MSTNEPYPGTQAVLRALTLLKTFTDKKPELSLIELADAVGLNKTTAYRLLTALESEGLVTRNQIADTYRLGSETIVLGGRAMRANNLQKVCRPELEMLAGKTKETVTVEILSGEQALTLDEISGSYVVGMSGYIGTSWPLHATSTGKLLLAHLSEARLEPLLTKPMTRYTPKTIVDTIMLQRELVQIRDKGYALGQEELEIGFVSVAVPLRDHTSEVIAAIGVGGSSARLQEDNLLELIELAKVAAQRISAQLGYREPITKS